MATVLLVQPHTGREDSHQNCHSKSPGLGVQTALVNEGVMGGGSHHGQTLQPAFVGRSLLPAHGEGVSTDPPVPFPPLLQHPATGLYFTTQPSAALPLLPAGEEMGGGWESACGMGSSSWGFSTGRRAGGIQGCLSTELARVRFEAGKHQLSNARLSTCFVPAISRFGPTTQLAEGVTHHAEPGV